MIRHLTILLLIPGMALAEQPNSVTFSGVYFYNFENAAFTADGSKECWVASGDMSKAEKPAPSHGDASGRTKVILRGVLGPAGHFGNLGSCTHMLRVEEIVEAHFLE